MDPESIAILRESRIAALVASLRKLDQEERAEVMDHFCRGCYDTIHGYDWSGRNFCEHCSPDPKE